MPPATLHDHPPAFRHGFFERGGRVNGGACPPHDLRNPKIRRVPARTTFLQLLTVAERKEGTAISPVSTSDCGSQQRVAIVYRHTLLRDLLTRILSEAGISVVAAIPVDELRPSSVQDLDTDVIVLDEVIGSTFGMINQAIVSGSRPGSITKVVAVGLGYLISIVYDKEVIQGAGIEDLIARVRQPPAVPAVEVGNRNEGADGADGHAAPGFGNAGASGRE